MVVPGCQVFCSEKSENSESKTDFVIQLCEEVREDNTTTIVGWIIF